MVGHPSSIHCKWSQSIRTGLAPSISQSSIGGVQVLVGIIHSGCGLPHAAAGFSGTCTALRQRQSSCSPSMSTSRTHKRARTTQD